MIHYMYKSQILLFCLTSFWVSTELNFLYRASKMWMSIKIYFIISFLLSFLVRLHIMDSSVLIWFTFRRFCDGVVRVQQFTTSTLWVRLCVRSDIRCLGLWEKLYSVSTLFDRAIWCAYHLGKYRYHLRRHKTGYVFLILFFSSLLIDRKECSYLECDETPP